MLSDKAFRQRKAELETKVAQLKVENANLLQHITDISQKYKEAAVDNRVLKADIETLRAQLKMAEDKLERITGVNTMYHIMPKILTVELPFERSTSYPLPDAGFPAQEDPKNHVYQAAADNPICRHDLRVNNALADISSVENI